MKNKTIILSIILFLSFFVLNVEGQEAVDKFRASFYSASTLKGQLSITYESGEVLTGSFLYMRPGKIYVKFTSPYEKYIVTNGKKLWIYDPATQVCGVQEMETGGQAMENAEGEGRLLLGGGIERYLKGYTVVSVSGDGGGNIIELENSAKDYSSVKIILDSEFMLSKLILKGKDGAGYAVKLTGVRTNENITPGVFNFNVPANAQIVKNPLDVR